MEELRNFYDSIFQFWIKNLIKEKLFTMINKNFELMDSFDHKPFCFAVSDEVEKYSKKVPWSMFEAHRGFQAILKILNSEKQAV